MAVYAGLTCGQFGNTLGARRVLRSERGRTLFRATVLAHTTSPGNGAGATEGGRRTMETTVVDVPERGRFEIRTGDRVVGLASYHVDGRTMTLPHTEVDPSMGGRGLGSRLVAG